MEFQYQSEKRLEMLKKRVRRCVCRSCGGRLHLRQIDFNDFEDARVEIFCEHCDRIEFGIEPEIYASACYYVDEYRVNLHPDLGNNQTTRRMTVSNIADIMSWVLQNLGYLEKDGFVVPPNTENKMLGECVVLDDALLARLEKEMEPE